MGKRPLIDTPKSRRQYSDPFKRDAVQMLLDGHTATSLVDRFGLSGTNLLHRWKRDPP
jgi:transposase